MAARAHEAKRSFQAMHHGGLIFSWLCLKLGCEKPMMRRAWKTNDKAEKRVYWNHGDFRVPPLFRHFSDKAVKAGLSSDLGC